MGKKIETSRLGEEKKQPQQILPRWYYCSSVPAFLLKVICVTCLLCSNCCNGNSSSSPSLTTTQRSSPSLQQQKQLKNLSQVAPLLAPQIAPILGESAIIDKESGRVYWQGGEQSLLHQIVGHTYMKNKTGLARHVRATIYSCILWISVLRYFANKMLLYLQHLDHSVMVMVVSKRIQKIIKYVTSALRLFLICIACLPKLSRNFATAIGICYIIESFTCSTRKYLDNAYTPEAVENYLVSECR